MALTYRDSADDSSATVNGDLFVRDHETPLHFVEWNQAMLQRMLRTGPKLTDRKFSWQADYDPEPTAVAASVEGIAASAFSTDLSTSEPSILANYVHHYADAFGISDLQRAFTTTYGDAWDYQEAKRYRLAVKQMDVNLLWSTALAGDGMGGSDAPKTAGLAYWAVYTASQRAIAANGTIATATIPVTLCGTGQQQASGAPVTDTVFNAFLQSMKSNNADISRLICMTGLAGKTQASSFLRVYDSGAGTAVPLYQYQRALGEKTAGQVVDWYESDWGVVGFAVNKYMNATYDHTLNPAGSAGDFTMEGEDSYLFFDPTTVVIRPLVPYNTKRMGTTGLSETAMISVAMGLQVYNPRDLGVICNIDGS